jgi:hypothetical protein
MKKFYVLLAAVLFSTVIFAQNRNVIFGVDMTGVTVRPTDSILLGGGFTTPAWSPKSFRLRKQGATSNLYARMFSIPVSATAIQYKYVINDWGTNEFTDGMIPSGGCAAGDGGGNVNRTYVVTAGTTTAVVLFKYNTCTATTLTLGSQDLRNDMMVVMAPNPMQDVTYLAFENPNNNAFTVSITNVLGQNVRTYNEVRGDVLEIKRGTMTKGVYFATMRAKDGRSLTERFVVE